MVEDFTIIQSLLLFLLSVDRYCSLFPNYTPFVKKKFAFCCVALLPYLFGLILFDHSVLIRFVSSNAASVIRWDFNYCRPQIPFSLCVLTIPTLLALVFAVCSSVRLLQERSTSNPNHDLSCTLTLLLILLIQNFERFGLFLELLHSNYVIEIVVGSKQGDELVREILEKYYLVGC